MQCAAAFLTLTVTYTMHALVRLMVTNWQMRGAYFCVRRFGERGVEGVHHRGIEELLAADVSFEEYVPDWYQRAVVSELVSGNCMGEASSSCVAWTELQV